MFDAGLDNVTMDARTLNIDTYNGQTMLHSLNGSDVCDEALRGATEGVLFQQNVQRNRSLSVYRKGFCRTLAIEYQKEEPAENVNGNPGGLRFVIPAQAFNSSQKKEHACHCGRKQKNDECALKDGLSDITNCYYGKHFPIFYLITKRISNKNIFVVIFIPYGIMHIWEFFFALYY